MGGGGEERRGRGVSYQVALSKGRWPKTLRSGAGARNRSRGRSVPMDATLDLVPST